MKSKKDQGNALYTKQKYAQAVECYKQYVSKDNGDNCKAYSNMALCYYKLKQYTNCIQACQKAVQLQPQFEKPFFRMYQAYKQLNDNYGMLISGNRFCKLSKQQKQIKAVQKQLVKIREELCFNYMRQSQKNKTEQEKIIDELVRMGQSRQDEDIVSKETQMCKQSKWERIVDRVRESKRQGLNLAMRFINTQCQSQQEKEKYRKVYSKLRKMPIEITNSQTDGKINKQLENTKQLIINNTNGSQSSQQSVRIEQVQRYAEQHKKRSKQQQYEQEQKQQQQQEQHKQIYEQKHDVVKYSQSKSNDIYCGVVRVGVSDHNIDNSNLKEKKQLQRQQSFQQHNQKWQEFVTLQQAQRLFNEYINSKLLKADDPFVTFYQTLGLTLRSRQLDRFQKWAVLTLCPMKVKKFVMLMKSYSAKQKLQLEELFVENNLHKVWRQSYVTTNNKK